MAALLIERGSFRRVKHVDGPITIGRSSANRIVIPDKSVSERQAVIGRSGNQLIMRVLDGKQGVIVNGELIRESRVLQSGDWLQIGDARMTVQLDDPGREDISKTNGSGQPSAHPSTPPPLPQMDSFRSTVVSAAIEPSPPPVAAPDHTIAQTCSVCRCGVSDNEKFVACLACGLPYHADCWKENQGCATYGCSQVGVLKTGPDIRISSSALGPSIPPNPATPTLPQPMSTEYMPWEYLLLAASGLAALISLVAYGLPSLLIGIGTGHLLVNATDDSRSLHPRPLLRSSTIIPQDSGRPANNRLIVYRLSLAISIVGTITGIILSIFSR